MEYAKNLSPEQRIENLERKVGLYYINPTYVYANIGKYVLERTSRKNAQTRTNEKLYFNTLYEYLNEKNIQFTHEITTEHINEYKQRLLKRLSPASVNRQFNTLKNFFRYLIKRQIIVFDPCIQVEQEKIIRKKIHTWPNRERLMVMRKLDRDTRRIFKFIYLTGARSGEAVNFMQTDIELESELIWLTSKKNADIKREFPISPRLGKFLHNMKMNGLYVFTCSNSRNQSDNPPRTKFTSDSLCKRIRKAVLELGINPNLNIKSLRHTYCKDLLANGESKPQVQFLMGHKSYKTTENYVHWDVKNSIKANERIGR